MWDLFNLLEIKKFKELLKTKEEKLPIVILTGSGISAESGIPTFRGKNGLWNGVRVEEVCRPESFEFNPNRVVDFYNQRRLDMNRSDIKPNLAHLALAKLEQELEEVYIITQNVDDLHEQSGSKKVYHIHGFLNKNRCHYCKDTIYSEAPIPFPNKCLKCNKENQLRPDVVFFKELPYFMRESEILLNSSKIFISIGTSGLVYPAAGFVEKAKENGSICLEVNPQETGTSKSFNLRIKRKAGSILPKMSEELIKILRK